MPRGHISRGSKGTRRSYKTNKYAGKRLQRPPSKRWVRKKRSARAQSHQIMQLCRAVRSNTKILNGPRRTQHLSTLFSHDIYHPVDLPGGLPGKDYNGMFWPLHYNPWQDTYPLIPAVPKMKTEAVFDPNQIALQDAHRVYFHGFNLKGKITPYDESGLIDMTLYLVQAPESVINATKSFTLDTSGTGDAFSPVLNAGGADTDFTCSKDYSNFMLNSGRFKILRSKRFVTSGISTSAGGNVPSERPNYHHFNWYIPMRYMYTAPTTDGNQGVVVNQKWFDLPAKMKFWVICANNNDPADEENPNISFNCVWNLSCWGNHTGPVP